MPSDIRKQRRAAIAKADERLLAELGYKQEFQRAFTQIEVNYVIIVYITPLITQKRYSGLRLALLDSCLLSRQYVPSFSSTTVLIA